MTNFIKKVMYNVKKERLLSISNILIMTITFVVLGLFINVVVLTQTALRYLEQQAQITVFFKDDFAIESITSLQAKYSKDPRVQEVRYISKEDAYKIFADINKNEPALLDSISSNILPASLELRAKNIGDLNTLATEFSKIDGVEEVRFFNDVINKFRFWSTIAYVLGFALAAMFITISYSVILSTIRSTITSRGPELEIMKLVGASDDFIRLPFIYQGVFFGVVSSAAAGLFFFLITTLLVVLKVFSWNIFVGFIYGLTMNPIVFAFILLLILIASGGLLGYLGSTTALKKYLKY